MLPPSHLQIYREFTLNLDVLKDALSQNTVDRSDLKSSVAKLQDFFQMQMVPIQDNDLDAHLAHAVRSLQVEIGKHLRLLALDCQFLHTARQSDTVTQRLAQMGDRLTLLQRYGEQLLHLGTD